MDINEELEELEKHFADLDRRREEKQKNNFSDKKVFNVRPINEESNNLLNLKISKKMSFFLVVVVIIIVSLVFYFVSLAGTKAKLKVPPGYRVVAPPNTPPKIEKI